MDFEQISRLSRLPLIERDQKTIKENLESIVEYVDKLKEVDVNVEHVHRQALVESDLRADEVMESSSDTLNLIFENMPRKRGDFLEVPKVFEKTN